MTLGQYFGFRCAEQCEQERFSAVKGLRISVSSASKGLCPFETCKPFFEGFDPKIYYFASPAAFAPPHKKFTPLS